mgnify:CR=1 FL=1
MTVFEGKLVSENVKVGIVASRLTEKYAVPAFMICLQDGRGKGSCRSCGAHSERAFQKVSAIQFHDSLSFRIRSCGTTARYCCTRLCE